MENANYILGREQPLEVSYPEKGRVKDRFGVVADAGFQPLPDVLLFNQAELGLRSEDLNVLLHVTAHWYLPERMPFPRAATIAKRMGVSERTVQRTLTRLRKLGLIGKVKNPDGRPAIDLAPLIQRLTPFAKKRQAEKAWSSGQVGIA
jgi:hypothetical protein